MARRSITEWLLSRPAPGLAGNSDGRLDTRQTGLVMGLWLPASPLVLLVAVLAYALAEGSTPSYFLELVGIGLIAAAAAWLLGALVGFLFGLPRTVVQAGTRPDAGGTAAPAQIVDPGPRAAVSVTTSPTWMRTNTNLEEISDWLTKILVGLGLVQLGAFVDRLDSSGAALAEGLGGGPGAKPFALALLVYALIDGFLFGYLWTRTVVSLRLKRAEEELARRREREDMFANLTNAVLATPPPPAPPTLPPPPPPSQPSGTSDAGGDKPAAPPDAAEAGTEESDDASGAEGAGADESRGE